MDNFLIPACIVLFITTVSALLQAAYWRKQARKSEHAAMDLARDVAYADRAGYTRGLATGLKQGVGLLYQAARKADHQGDDILAALRAAGRNLIEDESDSVVQVPVEAVSARHTR